MEARGSPAGQSGADDELGDLDQVAKLDQVGVTRKWR
jgi:hypothetical protein